jgi:hypothetical protein
MEMHEIEPGTRNCRDEMKNAERKVREDMNSDVAWNWSLAGEHGIFC